MTSPPNGERGIGLASCIVISKETKANASVIFLDNLIRVVIRIRSLRCKTAALQESREFSRGQSSVKSWEPRIQCGINHMIPVTSLDLALQLKIQNLKLLSFRDFLCLPWFKFFGSGFVLRFTTSICLICCSTSFALQFKI